MQLEFAVCPRRYGKFLVAVPEQFLLRSDLVTVVVGPPDYGTRAVGGDNRLALEVVIGAVLVVPHT